MRITIDVAKGYDDIITVTCVGYDGNTLRANVKAVNVSEHDGDTLRLNEDGTTEWRMENEHESKS